MGNSIVSGIDTDMMKCWFSSGCDRRFRLEYGELQTITYISYSLRPDRIHSLLRIDIV